jgi:hypothetical protein
MPSTDEMEAAVLAVLASEQDAWFNHFAPSIIEACGGSFDMAMAVCKHLRQQKRVDAQGSGKWAQYGHKE